MDVSIIVSGFGGQGALFAGQLLAYAGMDAGLHVTWIPSYGPEMRGGTAHCIVLISDEPIGAPIVAQPDIAIALNGPSFDKYEPLVLPGGLLVVNSSLVEARPDRKDIDYAFVPANDIAEKQGSTKMLNMAAIGAMLANRAIFPVERIAQTLKDHLPASKAHLFDNNIEVMKEGFKAGEGRGAYATAPL